MLCKRAVLFLLGYLAPLFGAMAATVEITDHFEATSLQREGTAIVLPLSKNYLAAMQNHPDITALDARDNNQRLWLKTQIVNVALHAKSLSVSVSPFAVESVFFYVLDERGRILTSGIYDSSQQLASARWPHSSVDFDLQLQEQQSLTLLLGMAGAIDRHHPVTLWDTQRRNENKHRVTLLYSAMMGMLILAFFYLIATYVITQAPGRFWTSVWCALFALFLYLKLGGLANFSLSAQTALMLSYALIMLNLTVMAKLVEHVIPALNLRRKTANLLLPIASTALAITVDFSSQLNVMHCQILPPVVFQLLLLWHYRATCHLRLLALIGACWAAIVTGYAAFAFALHKQQVIAATDLISLAIILIVVLLCLLAALEYKEKVKDLQKVSDHQQQIINLHRFYDLFSNAAEGLYTSNLQGDLKSANPAMCELFGYLDEAELLEKVSNTSEFYADPKDRDVLMGEMLEQRQLIGREVKGKRADGSLFWFSLSCQLRKTDDEHLIYGSLVDITHHKQSHLQHRYVSTHDALSGAYNRDEFAKQYAQISQSITPLGLIYLDIDKFKVINETCGYDAGDGLLKHIADIILSLLEEPGRLARLNGDVFAALLPACDASATHQFCNALQQRIKATPFEWQNNVFPITASIGCVSLDTMTITYQNALFMVESACRFAKQQGGNQIQRYREGLDDGTNHQRELSWIQTINHALIHDQFSLFYQRLQPLKDTSQPDYLELFVRVKDDRGNLANPDEFLPIAERFNLGIDIDLYVITHSFKWLNSLSDETRHSHKIGINLCGQSLADRNFKLQVMHLFEKYAIAYNVICFEVKESVVMTKRHNAIDFIDTFRSLGCTIALDNFGRNFSHYYELKSLPVDCIKIDGHLVTSMLDDPADAAVIKAIVDIAKALGIETVGEFAESPSLITELGKLGVTYAQGYGVHMPSPLSELND